MTDTRFDPSYEYDAGRRRDSEPRRWRANEDRQSPPHRFERFEEWEQPRGYEARREQRGQRERGESFVGRGPKGYQRSDERMREEICDRLTADPHIDASEITVTLRDGEVTLEGSVENRGMKRAAEDAADGILGLRQVHNRLRVEPSHTTGNGSRRTGEEGAGATSRSQDVSSFSPETQRSDGTRTPGRSSS